MYARSHATDRPLSSDKKGHHQPYALGNLGNTFPHRFLRGLLLRKDLQTIGLDWAFLPVGLAGLASLICIVFLREQQVEHSIEFVP
jgi:hypothetical protein